MRVVVCVFEHDSGHCQELSPKYREAAAILATADLPRPVVLAKYDDSTDSQRRLRAGAEDGAYHVLPSHSTIFFETEFLVNSVQLQRIPSTFRF